MNPSMLTLSLALFLVSLLPTPARAWHAQGHARMTRAAVAALPPTLPAFFREGTTTIVGATLDPDAFRGPVMPELTNQEGPEHFFDLELVAPTPVPADWTLPPNRYAFLALCREKGVEPNKVGLLPYAITEWTQRLAVAFAQHRRWPEDPGARARCLVYAGILAHYAQDLAQPLHLTIHYDGRADEKGKSPRSGIHHRVDALPGRPEMREAFAGAKIVPPPTAAVLSEVTRRILQSQAMVDRVYALESQFPPPKEEGAWTPSKAVRELAVDRFKAAAEFTASLYEAAWELSTRVPAPDWLSPEPVEAATRPSPGPTTRPATTGPKP